MPDLDVHASGEVSVYLADEAATLELGARLAQSLLKSHNLIFQCLL